MTAHCSRWFQPWLFAGVMAWQMAGVPIAAQEVKVRASIPKQGDLWVGQRVSIVVELLAPGFFASAPAYDLPSPAGLLILPPVGSPLVSAETIDDVSYTVQRHEFAAFARRGGEQSIPPLAIRFQYKRQPLDPQAVPAQVQTPPLHFTVKVPPGAEKLGSLLSAHDLKVTETWVPEPAHAKVGDAFTRTIQYSAADIPGMAFPPFPTSTVNGIGLYPKSPLVEDHADRGEVQGERRDTFVYICQRPGRFVIPAARLTWWDLDAKQLRTIDFPARRLEVVPNPALATSTGAADDVRPFPWPLVFRWGAGITLAGLGLFAGWRLGLGKALRRSLHYFRSVPLAPLNPSSVRRKD